MKKALFVLTLFSSIGFFNPMQIFSPQLTKLMFYLCICMCALLAVTDGRSLRGIDYLRKSYWLFMLMIAVSTVSATAFHPQSYSVTLMSTLPYFLGYFFFWIMLKLALPERFILKWMFIGCLLAVPVYFINLFSFPNVVFGEEFNLDTSRGMLRVPVFFLEIMAFFLFYGINQLLLGRGRKNLWIMICGVCTLMIFMSVVRQVILYSMVLCILFLLKRSSWTKKLMVVAAGIIVVVYVLPMIPAYNTMLELSGDQLEENEEKENVRIGAWRYYTFENQTNGLTPIIGNGSPSFGNSVWGNVFDDAIEDNGYLYADVAWAGIIYLFGWTGFAALLILILKAVFKRKTPEREYLTYWFVFIFLCGIGSGVFIYYNSIISIMIGLYLVFGTNEKNSDNNPQLQQPV